MARKTCVVILLVCLSSVDATLSMQRKQVIEIARLAGLCALATLASIANFVLFFLMGQYMSVRCWYALCSCTSSGLWTRSRATITLVADHGRDTTWRGVENSTEMASVLELLPGCDHCDMFHCVAQREGLQNA